MIQNLPAALAHGSAMLLRVLILAATTDLRPMQFALRAVLAENGLVPGGEELPFSGSSPDQDAATRWATECDSWLRPKIEAGCPAGEDPDRWMDGMVADVRALILGSNDAQETPDEPAHRWADRIARAIVTASVATYARPFDEATQES